MHYPIYNMFMYCTCTVTMCELRWALVNVNVHIIHVDLSTGQATMPIHKYNCVNVILCMSISNTSAYNDNNNIIMC